MKHTLRMISGLAVTTLAPISPAAEDTTDQSLEHLRTAAASFVTAFNDRDPEAIASLFTENGEISDLTGETVTSGRAAIQARYAKTFQDEDLPLVAVEVATVRFVAPNLAIEDGTLHFTTDETSAPDESVNYTAVLLKEDSGDWKIAHTRNLTDAGEPGSKLVGIAEDLVGTWTGETENADITLTFQWDEAGNFLTGSTLVEAPGADPQNGSIRIGWDGAKNTVTWWIFDSQGGFASGDWTPTPDGWNVRNQGTTSDGESRHASYQIVFDDENTMRWSTKNRVINGEMLPPLEITLKRKPATAEAPEAD